MRLDGMKLTNSNLWGENERNSHLVLRPWPDSRMVSVDERKRRGFREMGKIRGRGFGMRGTSGGWIRFKINLKCRRSDNTLWLHASPRLIVAPPPRPLGPRCSLPRQAPGLSETRWRTPHAVCPPWSFLLQALPVLFSRFTTMVPAAHFNVCWLALPARALICLREKSEFFPSNGRGWILLLRRVRQTSARLAINSESPAWRGQWRASSSTTSPVFGSRRRASLTLR